MGSLPQPTTPGDQAGAIFNHYFEQLARRAGVRWTDQNRADIYRAAQLLTTEDQPSDTIAPYRPQERTTVVLDRTADPASGDPNYQRWRMSRPMDDDDRAVARLVNRP